MIQVVLLVVLVAAAGPGRVWPRAQGELGQGVYVWQRDWAGVRAGVAAHGRAFASVLVVGAEIAWHASDGRASVARAGVDWEALKACGRPVGVAVRVGAAPSDAEGLIVGACRDVLAAARAAGVEPCEVQIDYDCATSKLGAYRGWVRAVREAVAPTPVTITALPAWLSSAEFAPLARETSGFVLQVHALERPRLDDPEARLCDDWHASAWVERAARAGVPFRVALPTYGYLVVYDAKGELKHVVAEGEAPEAAEGWRARELRADPAAMARLVRRWSEDRPALMRGVVWFRMPAEGDRLNWPWPTLAAVMRGETPAARLSVRVTPAGPGLREVALVNEGEAEARLPPEVRLRWQGDRPVAMDALGGLETVESRAGEVRFAKPARLALERIGAGESQAVGWIRLVSDTEVLGDVVP